MPKLLERITNIFTGKSSVRDAEGRALANKVIEHMEKKSSSQGSWAGLWARAKEQLLFGNKVTKPYSQVPTVYKAVKAIADNVPQAELIFKDWETEKEIFPKDLVGLMRQPNELMTYNTFMQYAAGFLALYGEVFIIKNASVGQLAGTYNLPAELWIFNPKKMAEEIVNGQLVGFRHTGSREFFALDQVIHIKDFNPENCYRGMSFDVPMDKIMDIDYASLIYNKVFFDNNATMGFMLSTDNGLSDKQYERLKTWLEKKHTGASNAYKTAILEAGLKPVQVGESHKDMDFIEQKRFTREELLGVWRVPKALFNITEDLNYATFIGQMKIFWQYALMPALMKISDSLNVGLVYPYNNKIYCEFDCSNVPAFQEDFKEKVEVGKVLFDMGFTGNEINEKLGLGFEPKPWRDKWWVPLSMVPSEVAEEVATLPAEPAPDDNPEPAAEPAKAAAKFSAEDVKAKASWKIFLSKQVLLESKFRGALKTHWYGQRARVLDSIKNQADISGWTSGLVDWKNENDLLIKKTRKYIYAGVNEGEDFARSLAGKMTPEQQATYETRKSAVIAERERQVTKINDTVRRQLTAEHASILAAGGDLKAFSDAARKIYNRAESRTLMQARTETSSALNGATQMYYAEIKVTHKKWVTAHDENVRDSHRKLDGEVVPIAGSFSNGMDWPGGDGAPEEVINCRCTTYPIFRKD